MEEPLISEFRKRILSGDFDNIPDLVSTLVRSSAPLAQAEPSESFDLVEQKKEFLLREQIRMIEYLLFEQKYMELVA